MAKLEFQKEFVKILKEKKHVAGIGVEAVKRWEKVTSSPSLKVFEEVCIANEIELPFFFDGKIESLLDYNKKIGAKMGFKIQITFES